MSHVITAVTPDDAPDLSAGSHEHREAEQMLIEEARRRQRRRQRVIAAALSTIVAAAGVAWPWRAERRTHVPSDLGPTRVLDGVPDLFGESSARLVVGPTARRRRDGLFHVEALEQWSRVHGRARDGARIQYLDLGLRGSVVQRVHHQSDQDRRRERTRGVRAAGIGDTANWPGSMCRAANVNAIRVALAGNHSLIGAVALRTAVCTVTKSMHTQSASLNPSGL